MELLQMFLIILSFENDRFALAKLTERVKYNKICANFRVQRIRWQGVVIYLFIIIMRVSPN